MLTNYKSTEAETVLAYRCLYRVYRMFAIFITDTKKYLISQLET